MRMIEREGHGAIVYQQQEGRGIGILNKIRAYALQDQGADTVEANEQLGLAVDLRNYRQCAEILFDLGLCEVKVISNNPLKLQALEDAGLNIVERVSIEVESTEDAASYLRTKRRSLVTCSHLREARSFMIQRDEAACNVRGLIFALCCYCLVRRSLMVPLIRSASAAWDRLRYFRVHLQLAHSSLNSDKGRQDTCVRAAGSHHHY